MKTLGDLINAIKDATDSSKYKAAISEIEKCIADKVDPFELYREKTSDCYMSPFEVALISSNTSLIYALLKPFRDDKNLLRSKLSQSTDNLNDMSINKSDTVRQKINFLQLALGYNDIEVIKLIFGCFGDDAYLKQSKFLESVINQPIELHGPEGIESYTISEYLTFYLLKSANSTNMMDTTFYENNEMEKPIEKYLKQRKYYAPGRGMETPKSPTDKFRFFLNRLPVFSLLITIDSINIEASTQSYDGLPYHELLQVVVSFMREPEKWSEYVSNRVNIGGEGSAVGFIEGGLPLARIEGMTNIFGFLPITAIYDLSEWSAINDLVQAHLAKLEEQRTRRRDSSFDKMKQNVSEVQQHVTTVQADVIEIKKDLKELIEEMDKKAMKALSAFGGSGSQHSDSTNSDSGKDSPKKSSGSDTDVLKDARLDFYNAIRDYLVEKLSESTSAKGRKDFFHNPALHLFVTTLSYGAYAVPAPGMQGVIAAPILMAGDWLQGALAKEKSERLICEIRSADRGIESKRKMAVLIAWGLTEKLANQIHATVENKKDLRGLIEQVQINVDKGIKALVDKKNIGKGSTPDQNPIEFFEQFVLDSVAKRQSKPGKKPGCVIC